MIYDCDGDCDQVAKIFDLSKISEWPNLYLAAVICIYILNWDRLNTVLRSSYCLKHIIPNS